MLVTIFHEWPLTSSKPASNLRTSTLLESGVTKDKDKSVVFLNDPSDTCSGSDGSCGVVWGEEMPLSSTEMPMPNGAEKIYESIYRSRDESVPLQTNSFALNFAGNPVEIPELDILVTGNYANFSAKNCTDCECQGKVESQQPFIEWSVMNNY